MAVAAVTFAVANLAGGWGADARVDAALPATARGTTERVERVLRCPGARKAVRYYRAAYARHRAAQRLPGPVPFVRYACEATIRRAVMWRDRAAAEREKAIAWRKYHYDWPSWLPANWRARRPRRSDRSARA